MAKRNNDIILAIGAVALCSSVALAGYIAGSYWQTVINPQILEATLRGASGSELYSLRMNYGLPAALFVVAGIILTMGGIAAYLSRREFKESQATQPEDEKKSLPYVTGVSSTASALIISGTALLSFAGSMNGAFSAVEYSAGPSIEAIEWMGVSAGVLGAVAIACFIVDFMKNRNVQPEQVV